MRSIRFLAPARLLVRVLSTRDEPDKASRKVRTHTELLPRSHSDYLKGLPFESMLELVLALARFSSADLVDLC